MHYYAKITAPGADNNKFRLAVVKQNACINIHNEDEGLDNQDQGLDNEDQGLDNQEIMGEFRFIKRLMLQANMHQGVT